jgi:hypothetical protein
MREFADERITHVVVGDLGTAATENAAVTATVKAFPDHFALLYENPSFKVYHVLAANAAGP